MTVDRVRSKAEALEVINLVSAKAKLFIKDWGVLDVAPNFSINDY
jgi:hypothetical protein